MNRYTGASTLVAVALLTGLGSTQSVAAESSISSDQLEQRREMLFYQIDSDTPFTGLIVEDFSDGQRKLVVNVVRGIPQRMTEWHENGQKAREASLDSNGNPNGLATEWYESGQVKSRGTLVNGRIREQETWDESGTNTTIRPEIKEALKLPMGAKAAVAEYYMDRGEFPIDNATAGMSEGSEITGKFVKSVVIDAGVITVRLEGDLGRGILVFTPTDPGGYVDWQCSSPDMSPKFLPEECR